MFKAVTLEMSLKPFKSTDDAYIKNVISKVFTGWHPLIKNREEISVMLWTADGSEILDYSGNLDEAFEWCYFVGNANKELATEEDGVDISLHDKKRLYMENPPVITYGILKKIISTIKEVGKSRYPNTKITVGETFDIGPEFSISHFKYSRHREITSGEKLDGLGFVDATALLNADDRHYAAYPNGIPEGTPLATFLGKQANVFLKDMGFDYLWLSNGLGFSANPWSSTGKVFDGEKFYAEKLTRTRNQVFEFWRLFREACPDYTLATRGTNNSVGIDYSTDGVPLHDIYNAGFNIKTPPNSPWAAINDNFGLEIMGHMTRICELPEDGFMFRYYIHDPWWVTTPWYDRYDGKPHDIYLPMAISRIDENGNVRSAESLNILSIDNSFGDMPDCCVNEPLPHLLKAEKDASDAPAPLVWVYPMREFTTSYDESALAEMYYGDNYISAAINDGFPLNCVISTDNFLKLDCSMFKNCILVSPIPQSGEIKQKLVDFEKAGGAVVYYGMEANAGELASAANFVSTASAPSKIREKLEDFDFCVRYVRKVTDTKTPCMTVSAYDNGLNLSVYNPNLTTETLLKFPLGAPILTNTETEIKDGFSSYYFGKSEHCECRVFVKQKSGVVYLREIAPVSLAYHRKLALGGLENADVYVFPENRGDKTIMVDSQKNSFDITPIFTDCFKRVEDEKYGVYYKAENFTGDCTLFLPR